MTNLLDVENLHKRYPLAGRGGWWQRKSQPLLHAVDDVSFSIAKGEALGLVGESGSGKSTLVQLVTRLLELSGGAIRFNGDDIGTVLPNTFTRAPQRANIQMVFQDAGEAINPRFSAFETIAHPLRKLKGLRGEALSTHVRATAEQVSFPVELLERFPHQLSGGQRARVGIARAIALEPELLVLDEPTSALDVSVQAVILKLLDKLQRERNLSYLFVSHDLNVVRLLCNRVMVMYLGKVVEEGPVDEVFERPRHPYTASLIAAIPGTRKSGKVLALPPLGEARSPVDPDPNICRYYGRCPFGKEDPCATTAPPLQPTGQGTHAACHFPRVAAGVA